MICFVKIRILDDSEMGKYNLIIQCIACQHFHYLIIIVLEISDKKIALCSQTGFFKKRIRSNQHYKENDRKLSRTSTSRSHIPPSKKQ